MVVQLPLGLSLQPTVNFETFITGDNATGVAAWQDMREPQVWIWGGQGVGKTHLLLAACQALVEQGKPVAYLPLGDVDELEPQVLDGLDTMRLVCIEATRQRVKKRSACLPRYTTGTEAEAAMKPCARRGDSSGDLPLVCKPESINGGTWRLETTSPDLEQGDVE